MSQLVHKFGSMKKDSVCLDVFNQFRECLLIVFYFVDSTVGYHNRENACLGDKECMRHKKKKKIVYVAKTDYSCAR